MAKTKTVERDARDFDTTQLHEAGHGRTLHRDYSAHFFRWSFARRYIKATDHVVEVGCGQDKPLSKILTGGAAAHVASYVGVDLNKVKPSASQKLEFLGEFNFIDRWKELQKRRPEGYDVLVTFEVVEHMHSRFMAPFMRAAFALLRPGGTMLISTPVYDGKRMAANHINEMTVETLQKYIQRGGFEVVQRFGTFMDIKHIGKVPSTMYPQGPEERAAITQVRDALKNYFDNDAISNIFGPLYPDHARNNLWVCRKPAK